MFKILLQFPTNHTQDIFLEDGQKRTQNLAIPVNSMFSRELAELARHIPNGVVKIEDFERKQELGAGAFGRVYRAIHRKSGIEVAIKELFIDEDLDRDKLRDFAHEVEMLWHCRYPFLLALYGFTLTPPLSIVMPYVCHGCLWDYVRSRQPKGRLDATQKSLIAIGVAYGMAHLHQNGIIHRDLKSMNILLDGRMLPFICDFGIARTCEGKGQIMTRECGTTYWMAPEQISSYHYDYKVDVYSYAMVLYEMLCEQVPFEGKDPMWVMQSVVDGERPKLPKKEPAVCQLIEACWAAEPKSRPGFPKIYKRLIDGEYLWEGTNAKALRAMKKLIKESRRERKKGT